VLCGDAVAIEYFACPKLHRHCGDAKPNLDHNIVTGITNRTHSSSDDLALTEALVTTD
jgi:hypothetical protein